MFGLQAELGAEETHVMEEGTSVPGWPPPVTRGCSSPRTGSSLVTFFGVGSDTA